MRIEWVSTSPCLTVQILWLHTSLGWGIAALVLLCAHLPITAAAVFVSWMGNPTSILAVRSVQQTPCAVRAVLLLVLTPVLDLGALTILHVMAILSTPPQRQAPPASDTLQAPGPAPAPHHMSAAAFQQQLMAGLEHAHHKPSKARAPKKQKQQGALSAACTSPPGLALQLLLAQHRAMMLAVQAVLHSLPMAGLLLAVLLADVAGVRAPAPRARRVAITQAVAACLASAAAAGLELAYTAFAATRANKAGPPAGAAKGRRSCKAALAAFPRQLARALKYSGGVVLPRTVEDRCGPSLGGGGTVFNMCDLDPGTGELTPVQAMLASSTWAHHHAHHALSITNTPPLSKPGRPSAASQHPTLVLLAAKAEAFDAMPMVLHAMHAYTASAAKTGSVSVYRNRVAPPQSPDLEEGGERGGDGRGGAGGQGQGQGLGQGQVPQVSVLFGVAQATVEPPAPWHVAKTLAALDPGWLVELGLGDVALTPDTLQVECVLGGGDMHACVGCGCG